MKKWDRACLILGNIISLDLIMISKKVDERGYSDLIKGDSVDLRL